MSAAANTAAASGRISAPWARYSSSAIAEPSPAPACTTTSCSCSTSSRTPEGVSATRYSSVLISVGTPTSMGDDLSSLEELAPSQREPEVDAITGRVQRAAGELLDALDPVAQGVAVAGQLARGALPLPVALDEDLERAQQLGGVGGVGALERAEDRVAERAQGVVVLHG